MRHGEIPQIKHNQRLFKVHYNVIIMPEAYLEPSQTCDGAFLWTQLTNEVGNYFVNIADQ